MPIASSSVEEYPGSTRGAHLCSPTVSAHVYLGRPHHAAQRHRAHHRAYPWHPCRAMRIARTAANGSAPGWRGNRMRRREFITVLCGGVVVWSLAAGAQQGAQRVRRIGILSGFAEDPLLESELLRPLAQLNRDNGRT